MDESRGAMGLLHRQVMGEFDKIQMRPQGPEFCIGRRQEQLVAYGLASRACSFTRTYALTHHGWGMITNAYSRYSLDLQRLVSIVLTTSSVSVRYPTIRREFYRFERI